MYKKNKIISEVKNISLDNKNNIDYAYNKININSYDEKSIGRICF